MLEHFDSREPDTQPNNVSYNCVIDYWTKSKQQVGAERAEAIFHEMQDRHIARGDLKPDVMIYKAVIFARSRSRQQSLLNEMLSLAEGGDTNFVPDV